jgi:hypothetical protein
MKLKLILTTAIVGGALALPSVSSAAPPPPPPPQLDTATATGSIGSGLGSTFNIQVDAHSGPSGENPGGFASFHTTVQIQVMGHTGDVDVRISGPVTCLNVTGNEAVIKIDATAAPFGGGGFPLGVVEIELVDNGGSGLDLFSAQTLPSSPTDCSGGTADAVPLDGRAVVFDAKPLPTIKEQCKNGGWHNYPQFKNQGQCIAFVNHGP